MVLNKVKKIDIIYTFVLAIFIVTLPACLHKNEPTQKSILNSENKNAKSKKQDKKSKKNKIRQKRKERKAKNKIEREKNKHKAFRDLSYDELKQSKERLVNEGKKDTAIKHIEKMIPLCNNINELRDLSLEISDLLFDTGDLKKAEQLYSQFCQSYPGDKNIEYANYRSILCNYWLTLDKERDQSATKNTINLAENFLERSEVFQKYNEDVKNILADCQATLLESEINVFKEYLNLGDQLSAKTRLASIEKEFSNKIPGIEPMLLALSCEYAELFSDKNLLDLKQQELSAKYPDFDSQNFVVAGSAKGPKQKKSFFSLI